jgi:hypothetical protein
MLKEQQFDCKTIYKPGVEKVNADSLSRLDNNESIVVNSIYFDQLIDCSLEQNKDPILFQVIYFEYFLSIFTNVSNFLSY